MLLLMINIIAMYLFEMSSRVCVVTTVDCVHTIDILLAWKRISFNRG